MTAKKSGRKQRSRKKRPDADRRASKPEIRVDPDWVGWAFLGTLVVATLAFFWSFIIDRGAVLFGTDMLSQAYQSRAFAIEEIRAGRGLPSWNPFVFAGLPYLSILPYPVYYPSSLLYFVMPLHRAIGWTFVLHFVIAGGTMYAFARELKITRGAAAVAGISYAFTGYLVSHLYAGQDGRMFAMSWTPALLWFAERAIARSRPVWFLGVAGVATLQVFTPHVQMMYFAAMAVTAYVGFRLVQVVRADAPRRRHALIMAGAFIGSYALAGLLALVEIWPTFNMLQFSHRVDRGYEYAASWSMPVRETVGAIVPAFQGYLQSYWGSNPFKLHTEYLGVAPVMLAVFAVLVRRRAASVLFFVGLGLLALLFAWGGATPVHRLFYETLPVMKSFRAPAMMYSIVALCVAVLAGFGAQCLYDRRQALSDRSDIAWTVLGAIGVGWALLWVWSLLSPDGFVNFWSALLYGSRDAARRAAAIGATAADVRAGLGIVTVVWWAGLAICRAAVVGRIGPLLACAVLSVLILADLWHVGRDFYGVVPIDDVTTADPAIEFLQAEPEPFRVLPLPSAYGPNDLMLHRIESVTGSQNFRLAWWDDLVGEDMRGLGDAALWPLLDLQYVVSGQPIEGPGLEIVHQTPGGRLVYSTGGEGRRAWIVRRSRFVDPDTALDALLDRAFDPYRTAILHTELRPAMGEEGGEDRVTWVRRHPGDLALDVDASSDGLLVVSEIYHPYWRATIDGEPTEISRANVALQGLAVPAGRHRVELVFDDPYVRYGRWGTVLGAALWLGLAIVGWRRRSDS